MPLYYWYGADLQGRVCSGEQFARDESNLRIKLAYKQIELLEWRTKLTGTGVSIHDKAQFFYHIASLLRAHVRIHEALVIVAAITHNVSLKAIASDCADGLATGMCLSDCIQGYPQIADELAMALIKAGEQMGDIAGALHDLVIYYRARELLNREIRSLLLMPFFTFIFFIIVLFGLLIIVIPRYEFFFQSFTGSLPSSTQLILAVSKWLRSYASIVSTAICACLVGGIYMLRHTVSAKRIIYWLALSLPGLRSVVILMAQARILHIIHLLYRAHIPVLTIFFVLEQTIENTYIKQDIAGIAERIAAGYSFERACAASRYFNTPELGALLAVGQSTGDMQSMLGYAASWYEERIKQMMHRIVTSVQPLVLLVLGLLIAGLIVAVYMPLLSLSTVVTS